MNTKYNPQPSYRQGREVNAIYFTEGDVLTSDEEVTMVVTMESGSLGYVPHILVTQPNGNENLFNIHHLLGVEFKDTEQ